MAMKSWVAGALKGTIGAADKYGDIQDEQRKFKNDQTKAQAEDMRQRRFAKFNYELKDSYSGSGKMQDGRELSKRELEKVDPDAALESKEAYGIRKKTEAEAEQEAKYQARLKESRTYSEGQAEKKGKAKSKKEQEKADTKYISDIEKRIRGSESAKDLGKTGELIAAMETSRVEKDPRLDKSPLVERAKFIDNVSQDILRGKDDGKSLKEVEADFKESNIPAADFKLALEYLKQTGGLEEGWVGYKGRGW